MQTPDSTASCEACREASEHLKGGRAQPAADAAQRAIELDPNTAQGHFLLGTALCKLRRITDGIDALRKGVALRPESRSGRANLALALSQDERLEEAIAIWQQLAHEDPEDARAAKALADLQRRHESAHALSDLDGAPKGEPAGFAPVLPPPPPPPPPPGVLPPSAPYPSGVQGGAAPLHGPLPPTVHATPMPAEGADGWSIDNIVAIITTPGDFFAAQRGQTDILKPLIFVLINTAIMVVVAGVCSLFGVTSALAGMSSALSGASALAGMVCTVIIGVPILLVLSFVAAGIVHLCVLIFGGDGGYAGTYRAMAYSWLPSVLSAVVGSLLGAIPINLTWITTSVSWGASIWGVVLLVIAFTHIHDLSVGRAIGAALLPYILAVGLVIMLVLGALASMFSPSMRSHGAPKAVPDGVCWHCEGPGREDCFYCEDGHRSCIGCGGTGEIRPGLACGTCGGRGAVTCRQCNGVGSKTCFFCDGTGRD